MMMLCTYSTVFRFNIEKVQKAPEVPNPVEQAHPDLETSVRQGGK
jgi:hypothetical protein